jgi:tetratricopeptide (TPR) repeat protein
MFAAVGAIVGLGAIFEHRRGATNAPYVPGSSAEIVERLATSPSESDLARARAAAQAAPGDPEQAAAFAERAIRESRRTGDPRFLGQARAALAPWWSKRDAAPRIVLLRATIAQSLHDFDGALVDLDALAKATPEDPQVWLTRSVVFFVTGRYQEARASCEHVAALASALVAGVCLATIDSVTGQAKDAYSKLAPLVERSSGSERAWAESTLGEIATRAGDDVAAEKHFKASLALDPEDRYTIGAYADLLLDLGRPAEVVPLVADRTADDGLLLRLAIAERRLKAPSATRDRDTLGERHAASRARGDVVHRREEARFELVLRNDAARALALALANFDVQKEPWDVRVVLESALATNDAGAATKALEFLHANHGDEPRLVALARRLEGR